MELFYSRRGEAPLAVVLCASSISFVDATALSVLEEMVASWKRREVHFYVASAYGQPKALLEAALGAVGDCSRTIDACLAAEHASRAVTTRRRRATSHDLPLVAGDDAFKVGFHRSLPSFQTLPTSPAGGAAGGVSVIVRIPMSRSRRAPRGGRQVRFVWTGRALGGWARS